MTERAGAWTDVDRGPTATGLGIALLAAAVAVLAIGGPIGSTVALPGALLLTLGSAAGSRRLAGVGTAVMLVAVVMAGIDGRDAGPLIVATLAALLAWDVARHAIALGEALGSRSDGTVATERVELVHAASTLGVGAAGVLLGYGAYSIGTGGSVTPLAAMLAGVTLLLVALR